MKSGFTDNPAKSRFELHIGDSFTYANYRIEGAQLFIDKVEAPAALRGTGAASKLMQHIMDVANESGLDVVPVCSYAAAWMQKNQKPDAPQIQQTRTEEKNMTEPRRIDHKNGGYEYRLNGALHREDGPAVESDKGDQWWFRNNLLHREDGPAVTHATGSKWWYQKGQLHREDGPAYEGADGTKAWYKNGAPFTPPANSNTAAPKPDTRRKPPALKP